MSIVSEERDILHRACSKTNIIREKRTLSYHLCSGIYNKMKHMLPKPTSSFISEVNNMNILQHVRNPSRLFREVDVIRAILIIHNH